VDGTLVDLRLDQLAALYRDVDERYAGYRCEGATECCRFGITGREPYVTPLELLAIRRAVAARGGALSPRKRALPERTCPLLDQQARCTVYAWRPLGCRTYWCHRAESTSPVAHAERTAFVRRLQALDGEKGRPLSRLL
jgi:Fe-S-cluster containining protein